MKKIIVISIVLIFGISLLSFVSAEEKYPTHQYDDRSPLPKDIPPGMMIFDASKFRPPKKIEGEVVSASESNGEIKIRIKDKLLPGVNSYTGPAPNSGINAFNVRIFVEGINGSTGNLNGSPKAVAFGESSEVHAQVFVPNGTLLVKASSTISGQYIGKYVDIGGGSIVEEELDEIAPVITLGIEDGILTKIPKWINKLTELEN